MSYCLNPHCLNPDNVGGDKVCQSCQASLLLKDRYLAIKLIGQGGFGRTLLAIDRALPDCPRCVIKQFLPQTLDTRQAMMLFEQEAVRLKALGEHEQIPALLDYFEQDGCQYLVQEFIDGENLAQELAQSGSFSEIQIRQLLIDLLSVLQFVHEQQVIHRDIKPQNIIRRASDRKLCLVDFGAAKLATGTALFKTGTLIGSAAYAAPEQLMGKAVFASDLYSLGVTCIHLLTQIDLFECYSIGQGTWVWGDYLSSPISPSLKAILEKMLRRGTSWRYPSAAAVQQDLYSASLKVEVQSLTSASKTTLPKADIPKTPALKPATVQPTLSKVSGEWNAKQYYKNCFVEGLYRSIAALLLLAAGGVFALIPSAYKAEAHFKAHAISTTGTIVHTTVTTHQVSSGYGSYPQKTYNSTIRFETVSGEVKTFSDSSSDCTGCDTKQVSVLYDPTHPNRARVGTEVNPLVVVFWGLFLGLLLLYGGVKMANIADQKKVKRRSWWACN